MEHIRDRLSEYLDDELPAAERNSVESHLAVCTDCGRQLAQMRGVVRLMGALPAARPSRSLVPSTRPVLVWLRPLRSFGAVATGLFIFAFMASATLETGARFGGAGTQGGSLIGGTRTANSPADLREDSSTQPSAAPGSLGATGPTSPQQRGGSEAVERDAVASTPVESPKLGPTPWLWAGLAGGSMGVALFAHWRLRRR